jgi:hypothetical protein
MMTQEEMNVAEQEMDQSLALYGVKTMKKRYTVEMSTTLIEPNLVIPAFKIWDSQRDYYGNLSNEQDKDPYLTRAEAARVCKYLNRWS